MQTAIPYMQFRGGSSKGLFFKAKDLPSDETARNKMILAAMEGVGQGDPRQIDGLGGGTSLTSKVAIVSRSKDKNADLDYLFLQVVIGKGTISTAQTCGNILAGVVPFAIESGMIKVKDPITTAKVKMLNTGGLCEISVQTPNGKVEYAGNAKVDGVPSTAAPIICNYLDTQGSTCGALLPTGNVIDIVEGIELTCIDNGMPQVMLRAKDLGITGFESPKELDSNTDLKAKLEQIRLKISHKMNLGDVSQTTIPKMCLIAPPQYGGVLTTRTFIPHVCHEAIGVLGAVSAATACLLKGAVTEGIMVLKDSKNLSIEHPTGEFTVNIDSEFQNDMLMIKKSGVMRTARLLSKGLVFIPNE
jgi:4-oxalomesaconate tautomerase